MACCLSQKTKQKIHVEVFIKLKLKENKYLVEENIRGEKFHS